MVEVSEDAGYDAILSSVRGVTLVRLEGSVRGTIEVIYRPVYTELYIRSRIYGVVYGSVSDRGIMEVTSHSVRHIPIPLGREEEENHQGGAGLYGNEAYEDGEAALTPNPNPNPNPNPKPKPDFWVVFPQGVAVTGL